jgi:hypothetical protein
MLRQVHLLGIRLAASSVGAGFEDLTGGFCARLASSRSIAHRWRRSSSSRRRGIPTVEIARPLPIPQRRCPSWLFHSRSPSRRWRASGAGFSGAAGVRGCVRRSGCSSSLRPSPSVGYSRFGSACSSSSGRPGRSFVVRRSGCGNGCQHCASHGRSPPIIIRVSGVRVPPPASTRQRRMARATPQGSSGRALKGSPPPPARRGGV